MNLDEPFVATAEGAVVMRHRILAGLTVLFLVACGDTQGTPAHTVADTGGSGGSGTTGMDDSGGTQSGTGGTTGTGGLASGGEMGTGGFATGGAETGGNTSLGCSDSPPSLTGGTEHCSSNAQGNVGSYTWTIWSSGNGGCVTPYGVDAAFRATWNNSGDFLARVGIQWDSSKTYDQYGTISADFAETKTGTGGGYSYIGIYGWSVQPTHEWYIIDDSFNGLPFNPGGTKLDTVTVDGGTYDIISRNASGASIDGSSSWVQFYSIRQTARQSGHISITEHFKAWAAAGLTLGKMYEAKLLVEAGGGTGSVDFTCATFTVE